jgi:SAM-dependent methyltransferase
MKLQDLLRGTTPREPRHRAMVGGMWDEMGALQRDFLISQGLQPHHTLLDIGCGSLRGGVHAIRYLEPFNYYGVDRDGELLRCARRIELPAHGIVEKQPNLLQNEEFDFARFGTRFDFALAQSVFTHLPFNSISRCLVEVAGVLKPDGRFFATIFEQPDAFTLEPILQPGTAEYDPFLTYVDRDPYHYPARLFEAFCAGSPLEFRYLGDWGHPRNQRMLEFRRK